MINRLWGKKIGMTQVFSDDHKVVPVTVIDLTPWVITRLKTKERDGYDALQLGCIKPRHSEKPFDTSWLKSSQDYFSVFKEIKLSQAPTDFSVGQVLDNSIFFAENNFVDVTGTSIGHGFQGGVKRHGFTGGLASHGSKLGRRPGSVGNMRSQGRVIKGTRMAGHMGVDTCKMQNLKVIKYDPQAHIVLIKGSVPGKSGSLVLLERKSR